MLSGNGPWKLPTQRNARPSIRELSCQAPTFIHTGISGNFDAARAGKDPRTTLSNSRQARRAALAAPPRTSTMADMDHSRVAPLGTLVLTVRCAGVTTRAGGVI